MQCLSLTYIPIWCTTQHATCKTQNATRNTHRRHHPPYIQGFLLRRPSNDYCPLVLLPWFMIYSLTIYECVNQLVSSRLLPHSQRPPPRSFMTEQSKVQISSTKSQHFSSRFLVLSLSSLIWLFFPVYCCCLSSHSLQNHLCLIVFFTV